MNNTHKTFLGKTFPSGAEEWDCDTCGRKVLIDWKHNKKITLESGDESVVHSGGKGGLSIEIKLKEQDNG